MNLLLYPEAVKFKRAPCRSIPTRFQYLEGCVRKEKPYDGADLREEQRRAADLRLLRRLGAGDTDLLKRIIAALGKTRYRALVNVGDYKDAVHRRAART